MRVWQSLAVTHEVATSPAGLGMGRDCARGLPVLAGSRRHSRAQNKRPKVRAPKVPSGKRPKQQVAYSLGRGVRIFRQSSSARIGMGRDFARGLRVPAESRGDSHAQK